MSPPTAARSLAHFVAALTLDEVPPAVVARAMLLALDTLGNGLAAVHDDFGRAVREVAERLGGPPESTIIGGKAKVAATSAVLANATLAHGLDFDDTREDAIVHTGCVAVTTAFAVGEALGASGRAVLEALIAGVEVMCRVGLAVPGALHARHFHPTAIAGSFAAAAVAGKLHGLRENSLVHACRILEQELAFSNLKQNRRQPAEIGSNRRSARIRARRICEIRGGDFVYVGWCEHSASLDVRMRGIDQALHVGPRREEHDRGGECQTIVARCDRQRE